MPAQIYSYTPIIESGPNGRSLRAQLPEGALELCTLDGLAYVSMPDGAVLPAQHPEITLTPVALDAGLRERIKVESRACRLIAQRMVEQIRAAYTLDDEMYFARIGVGAANGLYAPTSDETQEMAVFGEFVESVRQWGRSERAKLGL